MAILSRHIALHQDVEWTVYRPEFPINFSSPVLEISGQVKKSVQEIIFMPYSYCTSTCPEIAGQSHSWITVS